MEMPSISSTPRMVEDIFKSFSARRSTIVRALTSDVNEFYSLCDPGNVISFGLFLSPVPTFIKICKRKAVEEFSPLPYLATLLNCALWVFYGIPVVHPNSTLVWTINGIGLLLEGTYLTIFFIFAPRNGRLKVLKILAGELLFMTAVVLGVVLGAHTHEKRSLIVGILCVIFGTCMYASPLSIMLES